MGLSSACRTGQSRRVKTSSRRKVLYKSKQFWRACGNPCDQTFSLTYFAGPCHGCSYQVRDVFDVSLDSASLFVVQEGRHFTLACPWVLNAAMDASKSPSAMMAAFGIILAILAGDRANAGQDGKDVPRVAFFGFEFINTSLEPTAQAEVKRIRPLDDALRQKLAASGRFEIVDIPPDMTREITSGPAISNCNGCQREFAQRVGANWAAWGMVQKVSNLILNINVYMENADSGKMDESLIFAQLY